MLEDKIIFFDDLGFGWVVDDAVLREIEPYPGKEELTTDDYLFRIAQKTKRMPW